MSYRKFVTIYCDGCDNAEVTNKCRVGEAREYLSDWETGPDKDLCPDCAND